jgi:hypothetical protein
MIGFTRSTLTLRNWRRNSRNEKIYPLVLLFGLGKNKASSSAMANFVGGVLLIDLIEFGAEFTLNIKDGLERLMFPE